jgi:hypothetical protein
MTQPLPRRRRRYPAAIKTVFGTVATRILPQCRYDRMIMLAGHMRCGSTALSNILCSRNDISGQGESHLAYRTQTDLGVLAMSLTNRRVFKPTAPFLFDKILHNQYDQDVEETFFHARAIFLAREPAASIASIVSLAERASLPRFRTAETAARYYVDRMNAMAALWNRFPPERRIALTHDMLIRDPDSALSAISRALAITPALTNHYDPDRTPWRRGGGDPVNANRHSRIEPELRRAPVAPPAIDHDLWDACLQAFAAFERSTSTD